MVSVVDWGLRLTLGIMGSEAVHLTSGDSLPYPRALWGSECAP